MNGNDKNEQNKSQTQDLQNQESKTVGKESDFQNEPIAVEAPKEEKIEQIDYKDLFLRVSADLQNYQRRIDKQKNEWTLIAQESVILKFLPIIEDMDRALSKFSINDQVGISQWIEGLIVIHKNFKKMMHELGIEEIPTDGIFNPEVHEAIAQIDSPLNKPGQIVDVVSKGYKFRDKVIKYSQVAVAK